MPGRIELDRAQAHHLRGVLRLKQGDPVEAFDDAGNVAAATIDRCEPAHVWLRIEHVGHVEQAGASGQIIVASAIPRGERADWMVEKLSELGVWRFIPLLTARSVVKPAGRNKIERWRRLAAEAAKQSRRIGVMQIDEPMPLDQALALLGSASTAMFLSTQPDAPSIASPSSFILHPSTFFLFIGPEGGWTEEEIGRFNASGLTGVKLTGTILRVETAALAAAAIVASGAAAQAAQ